MNANTKISDLTVGELQALIREAMNAPRTVRGIEGIAQIFGVSYSTAKRIKASGIIGKAITQSGNVIVTDVDRARELFAKATRGNHS